MIKKFFSDRLNMIRIITLLIFFALVFKLIDLQIVKGDYYKKRSETVRTRNVNITAPRGNIVDRYGRVLATNKQSYSVNIVKAELPDETLNDIALTVINILERNGDKYRDEIPILLEPIRFTYEDDEVLWKEKYNIPLLATTGEAFLKLKLDYNISYDTVDVEAYSILKNDFEVELPFKLDELKFNYKIEEEYWKKNNGFDENSTAEEVFTKMISKYKIDMTKYTLIEAKKIISVKYLLGQKKYPAYVPVEIAANIKEETRVMIEESKVFIPGVEIMDKPLRKYPNYDFLCHVLGYLGKISPDQEDLFQKGYTPSDMIGKAGIEYSMEEYLKGTDGSKQIEVDAKGSLIDTIDVIEPVPGHTVMLTTGSRLQSVAEDILKTTIEEARSKKPFPETYSGAAVAIDVNTGAILALASEPKFDSNLFASGISNEDWKALHPTTADSYAPRPLINNAISYPLPPGSTMKLLTAIAGLTEGKINKKEYIYCKGRYTTIPGIAPSDSGGAVHGPTDILNAIKKSCNYYFFETGRRLGGELFEEYANKLGFGQYTGIELPYESRGMVEGPMYKKSMYESYIDSYLTYTIKLTDEEAKESIKAMIHDKPLPGQSSYQFYMEMKKRIRELGVTEDKMIDKIIWYITESRYRPGDVLNAAIGQGLNNVTVLQLANYAATVANGGTRYKPYIVEKVISHDGKTVFEKEPEIIEKLEVTQDDMDIIKKGMFKVTNEIGGTAWSSFTDSKVPICGKTGTAEAGKYRPDPIKNPKLYAKYNDHAWFIGFAPYDKPEIAVAAVVFQGGFGAGSAPIARAIIEEYLAPGQLDDEILPYDELLP